MPVYEYACADHGVFEALNPMARSAEPSPCPHCDTLASRVLSTPHLASGRSDYKARDRNERSRHEPRVVQREQKKDASGRPALRASHGSRPWALEHG